MFRLRPFPQGKVGRIVLFVLSVQLAGRVQHVLQVASRKLPITIFLIVFVHIKVDRSLAFIRISVVQNLLHQLNLLDDVSAGMRFDAGRQYVECLHCLMVTVGIVLSHLHRLQLLQTCLLGNLVLALVRIVFQMPHISDVAHIAHLVAQMLQVAEKQVESDGRTGMSQMGVAIDRRSAYIHAHVRCMQWFEGFFPSI